MRQAKVTQFSAVLMGILSICGLSSYANGVTTCADLVGIQIPPSAFSLQTTGASVGAAVIVPATPPGPTAVGEYCRVTGGIHPVDPLAPSILFQVNLPTTWNGKALQFGGGGYNGTVARGIGNVPSGPIDRPVPLGQGYATFGSDSGHEAAPPYSTTVASLDARFGLNDEALQNFASDALKKTRDAAVYIVELRYGKGPARTYFAGGSTGGREAMAVTQLWPENYDGAIAWYPAWNAASLDLQFGRVMRAFAVPNAYPNDAKKKLLYDAVIASCDKLDGLEDGVVSHVAACHFDARSLRCPGGGDTADTCLSDVQISAYDAYNTAIIFGYALGSGETQYPGFNVYAGADTRALLQLNTVAPAPLASPPLASEILTMPYPYNFWDGWIKYFVTRDTSFNSLLFDPQNPGVYQQRVAYLTGVQDINSTDLSAFANRGGKLLLAHGTADALVSTRATEDYYNRLIDRYGAKGTRSFVRYYEAPGFGHAISGSFMPAWDSLKALEDWVERGVAPTNQVMTDISAATRGRARPLCEYPKWPRYNGTGDPNSASSFKCLKAPGFHGYEDDDDDN
jgi:hypothetical protein